MTAVGGQNFATYPAGCIAGGPALTIPTVYWLAANNAYWSVYSGGYNYYIGGCGGDGWLPGLLRKRHHWSFSYGSVGAPQSGIDYMPSPKVSCDLGEPWHSSPQQTVQYGSVQGGAGYGASYWYQGGGLGGLGYGAGGGAQANNTPGGCSGQLVTCMHVLPDTTSYVVTIGAPTTAGGNNGGGAPGAVAVFW